MSAVEAVPSFRAEQGRISKIGDPERQEAVLQEGVQGLLEEYKWNPEKLEELLPAKAA